MASELDRQITVRLDGDRLVATLVVRAGTQARFVDTQTITAVCVGRGLLKTRDLDEAIARTATGFTASAERDQEFVIARGTPPVQGEGGRFELDGDLQLILDRALRLRQRARAAEADPTAREDPDAEPINHYDRSTLPIVAQGTHIGRIIPHTRGVDGTDVTGVTIKARHGLPAAVAFDESCIERLDDGRLIARRGGLLLIDQAPLRITGELEIPGAVDFSTGHVDFTGSVNVHKGVCDRFHVVAGESIAVGELVEAATLRAGGDIALARGMAGRDKGSLTAGGSVRARFIDAARVTAGRDIAIARELTNCETFAGGRALCANAAIIGGSLAVAGEAEFAQVGSDAGTPTALRLGRLGRITELIAGGTEHLTELKARAEAVTRELTALKLNAAKLTPTQAERMTELEFAAAETHARAAELRQTIARAFDLHAGHTDCRLTVTGRLNAGAVIHAGRSVLTVTRSVDGPIRISAEHGGPIMALSLRTNIEIPIAAIGRVTTDPTAFDPAAVTQALAA
jgi:hypothetical protein